MPAGLGNILDALSQPAPIPSRLPNVFTPQPTTSDLLRHVYFDSPPPQTLTAPPKTVSGRIQDGLATVMQKLGYDPRHAQSFAGKATSFLNDTTPVGSAISADNAKTDFQQGNYAGAAGNGLMSLLGMVPDGGALTGKGLAALHAIIAPLWHGSPHAFEKFALDKIGTGEGAQAYGHGLYFAENKNVAQDYRDKLSFNPMQTPADLAKSVLDTMGGDRDAALEELNHRINAYLNTPAKYRTPDGYDRFMAAKQAIHGQKESQVGGHLYQVKLDANPEDFMNWNEPLTAQSPQVRDAAAQIYNDSPNMMARYSPDTLPDFPGHVFYDAFSREHGGRPGISAALQNNGVQGIRYLDQGSRGVGNGTRNYVVFDPSIIDILGRQ